jgi:hypothetical protein
VPELTALVELVVAFYAREEQQTPNDKNQKHVRACPVWVLLVVF